MVWHWTSSSRRIICDNEYVEEEDEVTDEEGSEDGDSDSDDDMDDQDWWAPFTFHYNDLILVSCNLCCFETL